MCLKTQTSKNKEDNIWIKKTQQQHNSEQSLEHSALAQRIKGLSE
jgi:hypothetical protein